MAPGVAARCSAVSVVVASAIAIGALGAASLWGSSDANAGVRQPIVTVVRQGGLCASRTACRSTFRISDAIITGDGFRPRRITPNERQALLHALAGLDPGYLRAHPFRGTCPTAYDGTESIYRFRGFDRALASCTFDLRGVSAVRLAERLLATLRPR